LHITTETANLARVLVAGGANLVLTASNLLSTQDDVAVALVQHYDVPTYAMKGESHEVYYQHLHTTLDHRPQLTMDDGVDLVSEMHKNRSDLLANILGGTEETTTGVIRLRTMAKDGVLKFLVIAVNDALTKHIFDNRYGTGQSTLDALIWATNFLLAGKGFTVAGYGWCRRGIAMRSHGLGANVIVTEVDPLHALEAVMDGFRVLPMREAAAQSDFIVSATGDNHVIGKHAFEVLKDGCVLANSGHFNVEMNISHLEALIVSKRQPRPFVDEYELADRRHIRLIGEGRLVSLAAAGGYPAAVMDMSFANQTFSARYLVANHEKLENQVYVVTAEIDQEIARFKLEALGVRINTLTGEQATSLASWQDGTKADADAAQEGSVALLLYRPIWSLKNRLSIRQCAHGVLLSCLCVSSGKLLVKATYCHQMPCWQQVLLLAGARSGGHFLWLSEASATGRAAEQRLQHMVRNSGMRDVAALLATQPVPCGSRIGIVTNVSAPGILLVDACEAYGLTLPELSQETRPALRAFLPPQAGLSNPVDMIASAPPEPYRGSMEVVGTDPNIDVLVAMYIPPMVTKPEDVATAIVQGAGTVSAHKPVLTVLISSRGLLWLLALARTAHCWRIVLWKTPPRRLPMQCAIVAGGNDHVGRHIPFLPLPAGQYVPLLTVCWPTPRSPYGSNRWT
jgi:adenosylhomocysteinase